MVPETGLILNNEMHDFSIPNAPNGYDLLPSEANFIRPGKRPLSSMNPVMVEHLANGTLYLVTGALGGAHIITATMQVLWKVLDWKLSLDEAIEAPRFHDQLSPDRVSLPFFRFAISLQCTCHPPQERKKKKKKTSPEKGGSMHVRMAHEAVGVYKQIEFEYAYPNTTTHFIQNRGHSIFFAAYESGVHAIRKLANGTFESAADPKRYPSGGGFAV